MGNSGWTNDQPDNLTIPPGANPGEARIVIGPDLPPPLDTYTYTRLGATYRYISAIIFYRGGGTDDDYDYIAASQLVAGIGELVWHTGAVVNFAVQERAPGDPLVLELIDTNAGANLRTFAGDRISLLQTDIDNHVEVSNVGVRIQSGAGVGVLINLLAQAAVGNSAVLDLNPASSSAALLQTFGATNDIELNSSEDLLLIAAANMTATIAGLLSMVITGTITLQSLANLITLDASGGTLTIRGDIDWDSATTVSTGAVNAVGGGTTSVAYINNPGGIAVIGVAFIAPASGMELIHWYSRISNNTAGQGGFCGFNINNGAVVGAGTVFQAAADAKALRHVSAAITEIDKDGMTSLVTGLTPGNAYNVTLMFRSSAVANTAFFNDNEAIAQPVF